MPENPLFDTSPWTLLGPDWRELLKDADLKFQFRFATEHLDRFVEAQVDSRDSGGETAPETGEES